MSFRKQDPPNPGPAFKNFEPIRESLPTAFETSVTSASVASQIAAMDFIEEILFLAILVNHV